MNGDLFSEITGLSSIYFAAVMEVIDDDMDEEIASIVDVIRHQRGPSLFRQRW